MPITANVGERDVGTEGIELTCIDVLRFEASVHITDNDRSRYTSGISILSIEKWQYYTLVRDDLVSILQLIVFVICE